MGVSVSASTAIIVAGLFFAFTAFYPVAANGFERVTDAQHDVGERALERQNTAIGIDAAENRTVDGGDELVINATNDGSTGLVVSDTTLVVDNEYVDLADVNTTVYDRDGATGETDLWLTDETLEIVVVDADLETTIVSEAERVVVVTESGVRDATAVEGGA
ncbi:flagellin [Halorubrum sp. DTA98]|uniref:flagellin n=1 Tax=Halorubrum sp. DTA98 TaxID=3402163 RepID=UPI003AAE4E6F